MSSPRASGYVAVEHAPPSNRELPPRAPSAEGDAASGAGGAAGGAASGALSAEGGAAESGRSDLERTQRIGLGVFAVGATCVVVWIILPVGLGVFLGLLLAFTLHPTYERLSRRSRRPWVAVGLVLTTALALASALGGITALLIGQGGAVARQSAALWESLASDAWLSPEWVARLGRVGLAPSNLAARLQNAAGEIASRAVAIAGQILASTASTFLALFFAMMTMYFALQHWDRLRSRAEMLLPLRPDYTRALFEELRRVGRSTLLSAVVTGISQGAFAALGYWLSGISQPAFWGAVTAVASLVPVAGTLLVWGPASALLVLSGHPARGILEAAWGIAVVTGVCEYVIRPRLVGGEITMPTFITFASLFGGVELFGLKGLVLGPVLMSLGIAVLRIYASDVEARRRAAGPGSEPPPP